jgi:hypothetical protein
MKDDQPAFPSHNPLPQGLGGRMEFGMTLRDYFAAKALQAIAVESLKQNLGDLNLLTKNAYHIADAMMEARK